MEYKIGQILEFNEDVELETAVSGKKDIVKKGSKLIIGADKFAHHFHNGFVQPIGDDIKINGYDAKGLAYYITVFLHNRFPLYEMLEDYDYTKQEFIDEIMIALDEIGL